MLAALWELPYIYALALWMKADLHQFSSAVCTCALKGSV